MSRRGWSQKQDQAVKLLVEKIGTKNWSSVAYDLFHIYKFKERTGKQCRERYHNHLDPKISKRTWTAQEEAILFNMHRVYGNKWTSIAQHLSGRTDNTIKNHFYSTIRRSLRRMSKLIGSKNSTKQMKYIKPSTLSKIFAINTKPTSIQQIQEQRKKCVQNKAYQQLVEYINQNCTDLTDVILQFSTFKPKGKNCVIPPEQRVRYEKVLEKMTILNEIYQKMRKQQRKLNSTFNMHIEESSSEQSQDQNQSQQQIKATKVTRSKRQIKPPKKFQEEDLNLKKYKKPIVLKKNSILVRQLEQKSHNQMIQKMEPQIKKFDGINEHLEIFNKQHQFQIELKEKEQNEYITNQFQIGPTPIAYTPNYYFNTPAIQFQSPSANLSATSRNSNDLFAHIGSLWNVKNGQLQDIANSLSSQIAKNQQNEGIRQDGKSSSSSNINTSPNSAFKTVQ